MPSLSQRAIVRANLTDFILGAIEYYTGSQTITHYRQRLILERQSHFRTPLKPMPIPSLSLETLTLTELKTLSNNFQSPVVIKNALADTPAVEHWSSEYINQHCANHPYEIVRAREDRRNNRDVEFSTMTFSDFNDQFRAGDRELALELCSEIFTDSPKLLADLESESLLEKTGFNNEFELSIFQLFLQSKGSLTDLHAASGGNIFLNIKGKKTWVFIAPKFSHLLHARPKPISDSFFKPFFHLDCVESFGKQGLLLQNIPRHQVTLDPGDVLYNPPWWWHAVFSEGNENIAVASRVSRKWWDLRFHQDPSIRNNPGYAILSVYLPIRLYLASRHLFSRLTTGSPGSSFQFLTELFKR